LLRREGRLTPKPPPDPAIKPPDAAFLCPDEAGSDHPEQGANADQGEAGGGLLAFGEIPEGQIEDKHARDGRADVARDGYKTGQDHQSREDGSGDDIGAELLTAGLFLQEQPQIAAVTIPDGGIVGKHELVEAGIGFRAQERLEAVPCGQERDDGEHNLESVHLLKITPWPDRENIIAAPEDDHAPCDAVGVGFSDMGADFLRGHKRLADMFLVTAEPSRLIAPPDPLGDIIGRGVVGVAEKHLCV